MVGKMEELGVDDKYQFKMAMLGNCLLTMGLPFWNLFNVGLVIWNGGFILHRIGH